MGKPDVANPTGTTDTIESACISCDHTTSHYLTASSCSRLFKQPRPKVPKERAQMLGTLKEDAQGTKRWSLTIEK